MEVISLDEDRIKFTDHEVFKKSTKSEYETLKKAAMLCKNLKNVSVPKLYGYNNGEICMERCYGENLELLLRNDNTHNDAVKHVNYLFSYLMNEKFFWKDFAPRNILLNDDKYIIMDFERGIAKEDISKELYLIESVYEEYGAFLLPEERIISTDEAFTILNDKMLNLSDISSKRVKEILKLLGYTSEVPLSKYALAVKMIVLNEEPYKTNNQIIFPVLELEEYIKSNGRKLYAKKIIGGYDERNRSL